MIQFMCSVIIVSVVLNGCAKGRNENNSINRADTTAPGISKALSEDTVEKKLGNDTLSSSVSVPPKTGSSKKTRVEAFGDIVKKLEEKYGTLNKEYYEKNDIWYLTGAYYEQVDFDGDGTDELMAICYAPTDENSYYCYDYRIYVYRFCDGEAERVFKHQGLYQNAYGDFSALYAGGYVVNYDGKSYLWLSNCSEDNKYDMENLFYGLKNDKMECIKSLACIGDETFDDEVM